MCSRTSADTMDMALGECANATSTHACYTHAACKV